MVEIFQRNLAAVDSTTLASLTALSMGDLFGTLVKNFMLKNLESFFQITVPNLGDKWFVALADSDASDAEISAALATTSVDREDSVEYRDGQNEVRRVWSIFKPPGDGLIAGGALSGMHQWKLPPKGIPLLKGRGLKMVVFNFSTADPFSNGPVLTFSSKAMGGWF